MDFSFSSLANVGKRHKIRGSADSGCARADGDTARGFMGESGGGGRGGGELKKCGRSLEGRHGKCGIAARILGEDL